MEIKLRPYQLAAHDAAIAWIKKTTDPCCLELATGAGKSLIVAALSNTIRAMSNKHILCLAPSAELVIQNREKLLATGVNASLFSASAGAKCLKHPIVFGTPLTVKNKIQRFGNKFACVIIDECHGLTPTIKTIIASMREANPNLRVIGLSATPFRLGTGYIYQMDERGKIMDQAIDPYFTAKVYTVQARDLIKQGFLTQPIVGGIAGEHYDTINLELNAMGKFEAIDIDKAFVGQGRKTAAIIADVVANARGRQGVMIFAATIKHAQECVESLPPELTGLITGESLNRDEIIAKFKRRELKYLVNVNVLTIGFDAAHVDLIAILRATESVGLLQQIIGRGLRIDDGKEDCLILDYAENIERHCPDGDLFAPIILAKKKGETTEPINATCPSCSYENTFGARPNPSGFMINATGYFVDYLGEEIKGEHGSMPAHFGRRCTNLHLQNGKHYQCAYRWTFKECPECGKDNDITARYCSCCKMELVDPNEKLSSDFKALKKDPTQIQTDKIVSWIVAPTLDSKGNERVIVDFMTEYRKFRHWFFMDDRYKLMMEISDNGKVMPRTVTYQKQSSGFYKIYAFNRDTDDEILRKDQERLEASRKRKHDNVLPMA